VSIQQISPRVAEELIEAVHREQVLVAVAEVVFSELAGGITGVLEDFHDGRIIEAQAEGSARQANLSGRCGSAIAR
jgi:hypothetical protein